jgi:hypothetical protein
MQITFKTMLKANAVVHAHYNVAYKSQMRQTFQLNEQGVPQKWSLYTDVKFTNITLKFCQMRVIIMYS